MLISKQSTQMKLYSNVSAFFLIWVLAVFTIFFFGFSNFPHSGKFSANFFENLANWDGGHYLGIAQQGYREKFQYAFFPLYPILIGTVEKITQNYLLSAILVSIAASFLAVQLLYRLILLDFDKKVAEKVILALLFFPTSFYFLVVYSEGLFFLLVVATFYFLRQKKIVLSILFASLASATRMAGLAVVIALLLEVALTKGINRKNYFVLLSPVGLLAYIWYLYNQTGDPLYFITAQYHWQRVISAPGLAFWETLRNLNFNAFLDLLFAIFGVGMVFRSFRFLPASYGVYGMVSVLLPLLTPTLSSMPRFLLTIFPIFILMALIENKNLFFFYQLISVMLLAAFSILFINGYWVS